MNATEIRMITNSAQNEDSVMNEIWEKSMEKIKQVAMRGESEICFYDICHPCNKWYTQKRKMMLVDKLEHNGFRVTTGSRLGKGMGHWETPYVVW